MSVEAIRVAENDRDEPRPVAWWIFPTVPLVAAAVAFAWTLQGELSRVYGMTGSAWDLAYDQQVIWNISVGQGFYSSFAHANFLGIHLELIFVALAAVETVWASPAVLAGWSGLRSHRVAKWVLCVLVLTCKEDQVYTVGVIGLLMRVYGAPEIRKQWRFIVYLAAAWFLIGTGVVQQHFRNGGYSDFVYYRWLLGLDPSMPATVNTVLGAGFHPG